jgi:hypothetical protein
LILAKLGRDKEAMDDLRAAVDSKTANTEILRVLREIEAKHGSSGAAPAPSPESQPKPSS